METKLKVIDYDVLEKRGKRLIFFFIFLLLVVFLSLLSLIFIFPEKGSLLSYRTNIPSQWVAVYLDDGGTLYGHISSIGLTAFELKDVYVLDKFIKTEDKVENQDIKGVSQNFTVKTPSNTEGKFFLAKQDDSITVKNKSVIYWEIIDNLSEMAKILNKND
ncbi:MAG: hypothetical protein WC705_00590 [Candidatus Paceibacterota bacterium]|jgi:hypothetical protein